MDQCLEPTEMLSSGDTQTAAECLILVDEADREVGHASRTRCHEGTGLLHRAFSLFVFNERGEVLIQQRAEGKRLWPLYWSNSCCSHPRRAETMDSAVQGRPHEGPGPACPLHFLFQFKYSGQFGGAGGGRGLCSVFIGRCSAPAVRANRAEIAAWRWIAPEALDAQMAAGAARFTPWFIQEWERIRRDHQPAVRALVRG